MASPETFDLVVLGSGAAGQVPAYAARRAGWTVAIIDPRPPGGTCANRGCDAKKPLVNVAHTVHRARQMQGTGVAGSVRLDWPEMMRFQKSFTQPVPQNTQRDLADKGIDFIPEAPRFIDRNHLEAAGRTLTARHWIIATGRKPRPLNIPGADLAINSDAFLNLDDLPPRVVFLGGGYIAMEFAFVCAVAGREVVVIERGDHLLGPFEPDMADIVQHAAEQLGVQIITRHDVVALDQTADTLRVAAQPVGDDAPSDAEPRIYETDLIVNATGRIPVTDELNLLAADIAYTDRGVTVHPHLQSTTRDEVWAAGDVADTPGPPLTPVASLEAAALRDNLLHGKRRVPPTDLAIPSVAFTLPPCASVGLTEAQARKQYPTPRIAMKSLADHKHFKQDRQSHVAYKFIFESDTGPLVGAHLVGPACEELINLFALAVRTGCGEQEIRAMTMTYPSLSYALRKALA